jgi:hypothetical protein
VATAPSCAGGPPSIGRVVSQQRSELCFSNCSASRLAGDDSRQTNSRLCCCEFASLIRLASKVSRIRKFVATGQDRPLMGNPQINRFQMLIRNLRGLDFGFDGLPPTARLFSKLTWGTLTVPPIPRAEDTPSRGAADRGEHRVGSKLRHGGPVHRLIEATKSLSDRRGSCSRRGHCCR